MVDPTSGAGVPESLVAEKYRLTKLLGQGGMGSVWEGIHVSLGTRVAVKFIDAEHAASEDLRQRFVNEAKAAARLRSKHVVQVYDQGVTPDGRPYIVMEFLAGEPLDARLNRLGRLPIADTALLLLQVSRALSKAHDKGIIHRDLKPENIFLVWDEEDHKDIVKVVDFGIAKFTQGEVAGVSSSTRTGAVLGTPHYMSPEQARGLRSVDHRTDLWALGVIAYRAVVGKQPFDGEAVGDLLVKICTQDPPAPTTVCPDLSPAFDAWIARALAREPDSRFQSAGQLAESLCSVAGVEVAVSAATGGRAALHSDSALRIPTPPAEVTEVPLSTTLGPKSSRTPLVVALGVVGGLVLVGGFLGARALTGSTPASEGAAAVPSSSAMPAPVRAESPGEDKLAADPEVPTVAPVEPSAEGAASTRDSKPLAEAEVKTDEAASAATAAKAPTRRPPRARPARPAPAPKTSAATETAARPAPRAPAPRAPAPRPAPQDILGY